MHASFLLSATGLVAQAFAFPQLMDKRQEPRAWTAPGPGDVRAPCPGLNTLANHGYINHNGRGISKQSMQQGFLDAFGLAFEITQPGGQNALNLQCAGCQTFDLDTLNRPHAIEHDGSLTRNDAQLLGNQHADNHSFNQTVWTQTKDIYGCNTHVNAQLANHVRTTRFTQAQKEDFAGWFVRADGGSIAEHSFTLATMFDPTKGGIQNPQARLDWINAWYTEERLPTALGWRRPDTVSNDVFNSIANAVGSAPATSVVPKSVCSPSTTSSSSSSTSSSSKTTSTSSSDKPTSTSKSASNSASTTAAPKPTTASGSSSIASNSTTTSPSNSTTTTPPFPAGNSTMHAGSASGTGAGTTYISKPSAGFSTTISGSAPVDTGKPVPGSSGATSSNSQTTDKPSGGNASAPTGTSTSSSTQTVPASVTSSAQAKATELAGAAPSQPDAYHVVLTNAQWKSFTEVVYKYIVVVRNICSGLIGSHEVGSIPLPGSEDSTGNGAPWMGSMPAGPASPASPASPANPASPAAPTSPAGSGGPGFGSCQCQC